MEFNEQSQVKWPLVPLHSKSAIVCKKLLFMANKTALSNWKKTSEATTIYNHLCSSSTLDLHFNRIFQQIINLWTNIDFGQHQEESHLKSKRLKSISNSKPSSRVSLTLSDSKICTPSLILHFETHTIYANE